MRKHVQTILFVMLWGVIELSRAQTADLLLPSDVSQDVRVTVTVAKRARLEISNPVGIYSVTLADKRRGYLDIPGALVVKLWCNSPEGVKVRGRMVPLYFSRPLSEHSVGLMYRLGGYGTYRPVEDDWQGIYESQYMVKGESIIIDLRFSLDNDAPVGDYSFSAELEAQPN